MSASASRSNGTLIVKGLVYSFGSSKVHSTSMCPPRRLDDLDRLGPQMQLLDGLRAHRLLAALEIHQDAERIPVLRADLHPRHVHLDGFLDDGAEEALHFRRRYQLVHPDP
jgi:hypothetical protein